MNGMKAYLKTLKRLLFACFIAIGLTLLLYTVTSAACSIDSGGVQIGKSEATVPFTYARVTTSGLPVFGQPSDEAAGLPPVRTMDAGFVWLRLRSVQPLVENNRLWYQVYPDGYVHAEHVRFFEPSRFQGQHLPDSGKPFGWVLFGVTTASSPGAKPDKNARLMPRYTKVTILEEEKVGDWLWYRVGDKQWIEQRQIGVVQGSPRPPQVGESEKWIEVNLYEQTLAAYEGDRMVYATLVSSGLRNWQTPKGMFRVWAKVTSGKMSGRDGYPDYYYLADVPWSLYFEGSVALHGAYWHDRFGTPRSHGCVNLSPKDARWLFEWAAPSQGGQVWTLSSSDNLGTWVWVH